MYPHNSQEMQDALNAIFGANIKHHGEAFARAVVPQLWERACAYIYDPAPVGDPHRCVAHLEIADQIEKLGERVGAFYPAVQVAIAQLRAQIQKRDESTLAPYYFLALISVIASHRARIQ